MPKQDNPKSFRPTADDSALVRELMEFYGVSSETQLLRMAYRALNRERRALEDLYRRDRGPQPAAVPAPPPEPPRQSP